MKDKLNEIHEVATKKFKSDFSCSTLSTTEKIISDYNEILRNIEERFQCETDRYEHHFFHVLFCSITY